MSFCRYQQGTSNNVILNIWAYYLSKQLHYRDGYIYGYHYMFGTVDTRKLRNKHFVCVVILDSKVKPFLKL